MITKSTSYLLLTACAFALLTFTAKGIKAQAGATAMGVPSASREAGHLRSAHRRTVLEWLKSHEDLRVARDADCTNREGLKYTREYLKQPAYHPYYAVADFNRDGKQDFAVAFVRRQDGKKFAIAIFNGTADGFAVAHFIPNYDDLTSGGIFYRTRERMLLVGDFESDNCIVISPKRGANAYTEKDCLSDAGD